VFFYRRRFRIEGLSHLTSARLVGQERANIWKARRGQTSGRPSVYNLHMWKEPVHL